MFEKKFSVGLNLSEPEEDIIDFMEKYHEVLNSVYFSLPLGRTFYSRIQLEQEYRDEEKFLRIVQAIGQYGIRREVTLNTYHLSMEDLKRAFSYMDATFVPEEIVCLENYGKAIKDKYPTVELKYSFNNSLNLEKLPAGFDTIVVGKEFLRNEAIRHRLIDHSYGVTLLLNNGCAFSCHQPCSADRCKTLTEKLLQNRSVDELYAQQSFFPEELRLIFEHDPYGKKYKFKISNRPLGIKYTSRVLDEYISMGNPPRGQFSDWKRYGDFCTCNQMAIRFQKLDIENVMAYKSQYAGEYVNGCRRK